MTRIPLAELSDGQIADRYGKLKETIAIGNAELAMLKDEFDGRNLQSATGKRFFLAKTVTAFKSLPIEACRAALGAEWCREHETVGERVSWTVSPALKAPRKRAGA